MLIDFEGYPENKRFIFKEISLYDCVFKSYQNFFIRTNKPNNIKTYLWLVKHFHHIPYTYGDTSYKEILRKLNKSDIIYYVKGENKLNILKKILRNNLIINLEDYDCPPYSKLTEPPIKLKCEYKYHDNCEHCSLSKINKLAYWYDNESKGTLV